MSNTTQIKPDRNRRGKWPKAGNILAALRRSPLVGIELDVSRAREEERKIEL